MKMTEISYGRTYNTGKFESEKIILTASLDEDDNWETIAAVLKLRVRLIHEGKEESS